MEEGHLAPGTQAGPGGNEVPICNGAAAAMLDMSETAAPQAAGEMARRIARHPWGGTPLGPRHTWPGEVRCALALALASRQPVAVCVGPDHLQLYNDAAACLLALIYPPV